MSRPPPRLGRGLASLFQDTASASNTTSQLAVTTMQPGPFQPRAEIDPASLAGLIESIQSQGILQPLLVRPHPGQPALFQIIAGERRWRAAQAAGLHTVPVYIRTLTDSEALAAALVENLQRHDLNAIEEAEGYHRLMQEFGLSQDDLGRMVGKSRSHIANTLRLRQLSPGVRQHLVAGAITAGHARALLGRADADDLANNIVNEGLSVRQAEALARRPPPIPQAASHQSDAPGRDGDTVALERDLSGHLGIAVRISRRGEGGTVQLSFQTLDQLEGLVRLLQS